MTSLLSFESTAQVSHPGAFEMDTTDFSDLPLDSLEDNYSREVVSKPLLDRMEARAKC